MCEQKEGMHLSGKEEEESLEAKRHGPTQNVAFPFVGDCRLCFKTRSIARKKIAKSCSETVVVCNSDSTHTDERRWPKVAARM